MNNTRPIIIDCDTGRDDALAIWAALALDMKLAGVVTSYGNVALEQVTENTARILDLAGGHDVPLFAGASAPLRDHRFWHDVVLKRQTSSGNGVCNIAYPPPRRPVPAPAGPTEFAAFIRTLADQHGPLDYIILGPATNFAHLCAVMGEELRGVIANVTMMGGRFDALWDETPAADFNLVCDPYAVRAMFEAETATGLCPRFVPLNTTWPIALTLDAVEGLIPQNAMGEAARDLMIAHCRLFAPEPVFRFHDPAAVLALLNPDLFKPVTLDIEYDDTRPDFARLRRNTDGTGFPALLHMAGDADRDALLASILRGLGLFIPSKS